MAPQPDTRRVDKLHLTNRRLSNDFPPPHRTRILLGDQHPSVTIAREEEKRQIPSFKFITKLWSSFCSSFRRTYSETTPAAVAHFNPVLWRMYVLSATPGRGWEGRQSASTTTLCLIPLFECTFRWCACGGGDERILSN